MPITGIVTVGPESITIDGVNNQVVVGAGVTLYGNSGVVRLLHTMVMDLI